MKTIIYKFCDGTTNTVEVTDEECALYEEMGREEKRSERRETRRHVSMSYFESVGVEFEEQSEDIADVIDKKDKRKNFEKLISLLKPQQQELIKKIYFEGKTKSEIARSEGVGKSAISNRLTKIFKKINKLLKKG